MEHKKFSSRSLSADRVRCGRGPPPYIAVGTITPSRKREKPIAARDARARLVRFDGNTVYCAKHLHELDVVGLDGERCIAHAKCGACVELGWRDVRRASPPELFAHASPKLTSIRARAGASSSRTGALSARTSRTASSA